MRVTRDEILRLARRAYLHGQDTLADNLCEIAGYMGLSGNDDMDVLRRVGEFDHDPGLRVEEAVKRGWLLLEKGAFFP